MKIMSRLAEEEEVTSNIHHYERLEFLGDAVVEFITTTTLYHLFPDVEEGGLAVYRQALVENQHLAKLAKVWSALKVLKVKTSPLTLDCNRQRWLVW